MTSDTENAALDYLRRIRASLDRVEADVGDIKLRASSVEQHLGQMQIEMAGLNGRMDRFDERLTRMERRLDLVDV